MKRRGGVEKRRGQEDREERERAIGSVEEKATTKKRM